MAKTCAIILIINIFAILLLSLSSNILVHNAIDNDLLPEHANNIGFKENAQVETDNDFLIKASDIWIPVNISYQYISKNDSKCFTYVSNECFYHWIDEEFTNYVGNALRKTIRTNDDKIYIYVGTDSGNWITILNVNEMYNCYAQNIISDNDRTATIYDLNRPYRHPYQTYEYYACQSPILDCFKYMYKQFYIIDNVTYNIIEPMYYCDLAENENMINSNSKVIYYNKYNHSIHTFVIHEKSITPYINTDWSSFHDSVNDMKYKLRTASTLIMIILCISIVALLFGIFLYFKTLDWNDIKINKDKENQINKCKMVQQNNKGIINEQPGEALEQRGGESEGEFFVQMS